MTSVATVLPPPPAAAAAVDASISIKNEIQPCPETSASFFSRITFWWMNGLVSLGYKKALEMDDIFDLRTAEKAHPISKKFEEIWDQEKLKPKGYPLFRAMHRCFGPRFYSAGIFRVLSDACQLSAPIFVNRIILFMNDATQPMWMGFVWIGCLLVLQLINLVLANQYFFIATTSGIRIRTGLITLIYKKALKLSSKSKQKMTTGEIVNMMSIDAGKITEHCPQWHQSYCTVIQIIVCCVLLFHFIGWPMIAGVTVMIVIIPIQGFIARRLAKLRTQTLQITDQRIKVINEILQGIRVIKFYAWEDSFFAKMFGIRGNELNQLRNVALVKALNTSVMAAAPILTTVATFTLYVLLGNKLEPATIFTSLAYFNLLRVPITMFPQVLNSMVEAKVSIERMTTYLLSEELPQKLQGSNYETPVRVINGFFDWSAEEHANGNEQEDDSPQQDGDGKGAFLGKKAARSDSYYKEDAVVTVEMSDKSSSSSPLQSDVVAGGVGTLRDITFEVKKGGFVCVVGSVGSGKSNLLSALLGEMPRQSGIVEVTGSVAYCPQQAWIQNTTLRNNITFGLPFIKERYEQCLEVCALKPDIAILPNGDLTEIGEKGINLSGGQRQRVNVARAMYADADIYLLDDPLSAVDAHVGKHMFEKCIMGALKERTRILVTHQWQYLRYADKVLFIKDGMIAESGTHDELMAQKREYAHLMTTYMAELNKDGVDYSVPQTDSISISISSSSSSTDSITANSPSIASSSSPMASSSSSSATVTITPTDSSSGASTENNRARGGRVGQGGSGGGGGRLMQIEERARGGISSAVYKAYIKASGGTLTLAPVASFFILFQVAQVGTNWWLAMWSSDSFKLAAVAYLGVYCAAAVLSASLSFARDLTFYLAGIRAATTLHNSAFSRILHAPMSFFDTTPVGRILSRFSKDQESIDSSLITVLQQFFNTTTNIISVFVIICYVTPPFIVPLIPILAVYWRVREYYRCTSRELKRLDSLSRSPLYAHFAETLGGLSTIRAYSASGRFREGNEKRLDTNHRAYFAQISSQRWLSVRLEIVGCSIVFFAALCAVLTRAGIFSGLPFLKIDASLAGLSLTYSLQVINILNFTVRQATESETQMNCVERVHHYATEIENEAPAIIENSRPPQATSSAKTRKQANGAADMDNHQSAWPSQGCIRFDNVVMRYRKELDPVLRNISLEIKSQEKIGIAGRTGAGKSSLMIALFRLVELDSGTITIDDINIAKIGLKDLRSRLAIIPQDPVLFSGSVRFNLDPFAEYSDEEVWNALARAHLKSDIERLPDKLNAPVTENGENFSVGQRQLICLARAILRRSKILVMDEATASVDIETDALIQQTIRKEFKDCTVLTIAHRLNTIIDCDRIIVLQSGQVAEFDTPRALLANENSIFSGMVAETGSANANNLRRIALESDANEQDAFVINNLK